MGTNVVPVQFSKTLSETMTPVGSRRGMRRGRRGNLPGWSCWLVRVIYHRPSLMVIHHVNDRKTTLQFEMFTQHTNQL